MDTSYPEPVRHPTKEATNPSPNSTHPKGKFWTIAPANGTTRLPKTGILVAALSPPNAGRAYSTPHENRTFGSGSRQHRERAISKNEDVSVALPSAFIINFHSEPPTSRITGDRPAILFTLDESSEPVAETCPDDATPLSNDEHGLEDISKTDAVTFILYIANIRRWLAALITKKRDVAWDRDWRPRSGVLRPADSNKVFSFWLITTLGSPSL